MSDTPRTDAAWSCFSGYTEPLQDVKDLSHELERELTTITEQRDRLAEAMQTIIRIYENADKGCIPSSSDMYDEALQSLTTTEP